MKEFIKLALDKIELSNKALLKSICQSPDPLATMAILTDKLSPITGRKQNVIRGKVLVSVNTIMDEPHPFTLSFPISMVERKSLYLWIMPSEGIETEDEDTFKQWELKSKEYSALSPEEMKALRATQPEDNRLCQERVYGPWLEDKPNYLTEDWSRISNYQ